MKNEERIVELLAETLRNQDIQSEQLGLLTEKIGVTVTNLNTVTESLNTVTEKLDLLVDVVKDLATVVKSQTNTMERLVEKYDKSNYSGSLLVEK